MANPYPKTNMTVNEKELDIIYAGLLRLAKAKPNNEDLQYDINYLKAKLQEAGKRIQSKKEW